ncbi:MAG: FlaA1/EpsC-like NDP-sugar epimerase [Parvibaculaceae bacterium]|jgi:FlaA1/EpsC-like NDP-sugar epimerase
MLDKLANQILSLPGSRFQSPFDAHKASLENLFAAKHVLVLGASGSIGGATMEELIRADFPWTRLTLVDKDENGLTRLARRLNSLSARAATTPKQISFVCADINTIGDEFLAHFQNESLIVLNFAALKHVRSEANSESLKYMLRTNCLAPIALFHKLRALGTISNFFTISTDKAADPANYMGATKRMGEYLLRELADNHPETIFSSTRFANVLFSNGSISESIWQHTENREPFGIPKNINRFFITLQEAAHISLLSLSPEFANAISIPAGSVFKEEISIQSLTESICAARALTPYYVSDMESAQSSTLTADQTPIILTGGDTAGEKTSEVFESISEQAEAVAMAELKRIQLPPPLAGYDYATLSKLLAQDTWEPISTLFSNLPEFKHKASKLSLFNSI